LLTIAQGEQTNRERFLLNYRTEFQMLEELVGLTYQTWTRVGAEKDLNGNSHLSLVGLTMIYFRHTLTSIQRLMSSQSFSAWPTFRPGLEALMFAGKWVDEPANAKVWMDRRKGKAESKAYNRVFGGDNVISKALPHSKEFYRVLRNINDDLMHPNYEFFERDFNFGRVDGQAVAQIEFTDRDRDEHEGHLLAFLNLLDLIRLSTEEMVNTLYGPPSGEVRECVPVATLYDLRAADLASRSKLAKTAMVDLGLWEI
jgi:hypothetical protein